ncbi:MAG: ATP synthase F1 subunit gamma [Candidatus Levybacteria bacterium RIFCSPHIGHO2_12_FULL_38_12]|nr:MAG: ATP synthase F1 subunit gamma [Candidatus Levybacteria bacterium RIFCSPHIGHO2_01_FULL_38_12]OGH22430.1 MAG: ATP synthase F1 subunit gamma [Candidatus Levybacteria bacterium RIFCSPHIGHO2_02_FULL_37_18]OGH23395.1 MAG: ATP synthase F1 subunit gamma [Candidatus Levybacteria bacterium RIFCSPHIGHO2_12_FULL_38_12]OGH34904.1 MAG: ATP synthase F1 subunit gamma [Candidatus Levybacteria bacterium RIFCSPLOWO2_01_FULL_37_20]OGH43646.1 MAG: ATP synthase F1 subunit gamma [Candidatus Levybacteria bacte
MASMIQLKRRIKTAQNVSKTTKAMQLIATSKLKRAQEAALSSRPYVEKLESWSKRLSALKQEDFTHPYIEQAVDSKKTLLIVLSPDKGLCGGLITNVLREYMSFSSDSNIITTTVGKKIEIMALRSKNQLIASFPFGTTLPRFGMIFPILKIIDEYYLSKKVDTVKILYSRFASFFSQIPTVTTILPLTLPDETKDQQITISELFEPSIEVLLPQLLKHYIEMSLYHFLLENYVSEQTARMLAMQNATDNAHDIITQLTLEYNKARQEKITNEILDISSNSAFVYE